MVTTCLLGAGCQQQYSIEESKSIAQDFIQQSATLQFDGIDHSLELVNTGELECSGCWEFTCRFESRHSGYGDRAGQMLAQVITPHEAKITVERNEVTEGILDGTWNMLTESEVSAY